jgi:hypothetical protein
VTTTALVCASCAKAVERTADDDFQHATTADGLACTAWPVVPVRVAAGPLTCEHCKCAPATNLVVADLPSRRIARLVCGPCGERDRTDAALIAKATSAVWLFTLIPTGKAGR